VSTGWLVAPFAKYSLIRRPLRLYFLHELVLSEDAFFYQQLRHGICLGEASDYNSCNVTVSPLFAVAIVPPIFPSSVTPPDYKQSPIMPS